MDEDHLLADARAVALNPAPARLARQAQDWPHSSVRAHRQGRDDALDEALPPLERAPRFADLIEQEPGDGAFTSLRRSELIGRQLGAPVFVEAIERQPGRTLASGKRGPKPRVPSKAQGIR